jgi:FkbM family methyltransferase
MRPLLLRLAPKAIREKLFYRLYMHRQQHYKHLFPKADLAFSPGVSLYDLIPGDVISGNIAFNGFYELSLTRRICKLARHGGLFVDVGANVGYFSILWAATNKSARAICFEASPRNVKLLEKNINRNALAEQISLIAKAVGNQTTTIEFDLGPSGQTGWGGITTENSATSIQVPMTRLDMEIENETIEVLKIDVEGADTWVLLGCEQLLRARRIKTIFFEQNPHRMQLLGIRGGEAQSFLRDHGYQCTPLDEKSTEWIATPTN